jgi:hypothetical protein
LVFHRLTNENIPISFQADNVSVFQSLVRSPQIQPFWSVMSRHLRWMFLCKRKF